MEIKFRKDKLQCLLLVTPVWCAYGGGGGCPLNVLSDLAYEKSKTTNTLASGNYVYARNEQTF